MYKVTLALDSQMLADYCRYIFPQDPASGICKVSATHPAGQLIIAYAVPSAFPVQVTGDHLVELDIPWNRNATSSLQDHWVTLAKGAMARINLALKAEFELEFAGYYRRGEALGMRKMDIIDAFIFSRRLAPDNYDALHKRVYRNQQRAQEKIRKRLLRKAYYLNESIDYTGLNL